MKTLKAFAIIGALGVALAGSKVAAQTSSNQPPVVVSPTSPKIPSDIKALVRTFEMERDAYFAEQKALLEKLKNATTPQQREAIRDMLQDNRDGFLAELREFREELRQEIKELKGKINNQELQELIDKIKDKVQDSHHGRT